MVYRSRTDFCLLLLLDTEGGFLEATVELALQHPEVGENFRSYLKNLKL